MSFVLVAAAAQWACVDEARTETAAAHSRDSALVHDLVLAGYDSAALFQGGRYFGGPMTGGRTVTESPGDLADAGSRPSTELRSTPSASTPAPSAESHMDPSCASPADADQQRCLDGYLARSDGRLEQSYQALVTQLKAEAGTHAGAPEPATVQRLRTTQQNWVAYRNDECRKRTAATEGPLWAPVRARCLEEYSTLREREFDDALARRKVVADSLAKRKTAVTKSTPKKAKATRHTRRTKPKRSGWG